MQLLNKTFIRLDKILIPIKYFILISLHISIFSAFTALGEPDPPDKRVGKPLIDTYKKPKEKILLSKPSPYTTKSFLVQPSATRSEASLSPVNSKSIDLQESNKLNKQKQIIKLEKDILKNSEDIHKKALLRRMQHSLERQKKYPYPFSTTPEVKQKNILGDKNNKRENVLTLESYLLYPNIPKIQGIQITEPSISQQSTANIPPIATTSLVKTIVNTKTGISTSPSSSIEDLMEQVNGFKTAEKQLETKRIHKEEKLIKEEEFFKEIDSALTSSVERLNKQQSARSVEAKVIKDKIVKNLSKEIVNTAKDIHDLHAHTDIVRLDSEVTKKKIESMVSQESISSKDHSVDYTISTNSDVSDNLVTEPLLSKSKQEILTQTNLYSNIPTKSVISQDTEPIKLISY